MEAGAGDGSGEVSWVWVWGSTQRVPFGPWACGGVFVGLFIWETDSSWIKTTFCESWLWERSPLGNLFGFPLNRNLTGAAVGAQGRGGWGSQPLGNQPFCCTDPASLVAAEGKFLADTRGVLWEQSTCPSAAC